MSATPVWFGPADRPLFGWVHAPEAGRAVGAAVLCPPLGRELNCAQTTLRHLAAALAAAGMLAVRFDYDGTGDAAGADLDPDRVAAWCASVGEAVQLARHCGAGSVSLVGMRMGALLAAAAAPGLRDIDAVVLWDPCRSARAFLRQQGALHRMLTEQPDEVEGGTPLLGFLFSDQTVADLGTLAVPSGGHVPSRVLALTRPGVAGADALVDALGAPATCGTAIGQEEILEVEPLDRRVPAETVADIVRWLRAGVADRGFEVFVPNASEACFTWAGIELCERVRRLGPHGLFGIESAPAGGGSGPTVLMLNAGTDSHVGPSRLWVELSRRWAAAGLRCVRFDLSGLGDSPPRPGGPVNVSRAPEAFDDMVDVRSAVEPEDPGNVVLVGLCSGGYQALEDALVCPPRGLYAINPALHFSPPELAWGGVDPRRRICWPTKGLSQAYRSLLSEPLRRRLRRVAWVVARLCNPRRDRDPGRWLDELRQAGVELFVVCGPDQGMAFGSTARPEGASTPPEDPIRIEVIAGLDGALLPIGQRRQVTDRFTEHLVRHFAPVPVAASSDRAR